MPGLGWGSRLEQEAATPGQQLEDSEDLVGVYLTLLAPCCSTAGPEPRMDCVNHTATINLTPAAAEERRFRAFCC